MSSSHVRAGVTVRESCDLIAEILAPEVRREMVESLGAGEDSEASFARLRRAMRAHAFPANGATRSLGRVVQALDQRTKAEGFHVLESWDYVAHKFADQTVPVLMLDRCAASSDSGRGDAVRSILLDQYFLAVLGLIVVRAWDDPDPNSRFDDVTRMLGMLGDTTHRFVDDAATLLLLAVSHYHPQEAAYGTLIDRIATLDEGHRLDFALACAPVISGHFRWGLRFMYQRDVGRLRDDNVVDYPWLLLAARTLIEAYGQESQTSPRHAAIVEGLLAAVSADPWALTGKAPPCLRGRESEHAIVRAELHGQRDRLLRDFEAIRPSLKCYSPLGFEVNFLCNALVAMAMTAVADCDAHPSLNALLTTRRAGGGADASDQLERYARSLMAYASGSATPGAPALVVYDPYDAQHAFNMTLQVLRGSSSS